MGEKQHTLPAVYLAGFSTVVREPARRSRIWVGRRGVRHVYERKAEDVSWVRDIYKTATSMTIRSLENPQPPHNPNEIDELWKTYEGHIAPAFKALVERRRPFVESTLWMRLVNIITQFFVRGAEFHERYSSRIKTLMGGPLEFIKDEHTHTNHVRLMELGKLRGAVMHANWTVLHVERGRLITNDLARVGFRRRSTQEVGYVVPLRSDAALALAFSPTEGGRHVMPTPDDKWAVGVVKHVDLDSIQVTRLNASLARFARCEVYGAGERTIDEVHELMAPKPGPIFLAEPLYFRPPYFSDPGQQLANEAIMYLATPPSKNTYALPGKWPTRIGHMVLI